MATIKHIQVTPVEGATEPVSLDDQKGWMQVDFNDHDALITSMMKGARNRVEKYCNISITEKTILLYVDLEPGEIYELPYGPVQSIVSVEKVDSEGAETTLVLDTDYRVIGVVDSFKSLKSYYAGLHVIEYTVGYNDTPDSLLEAIKAETSFSFTNRGEVAKTGVCDYAQLLAAPYIRIWL